MLGLPSKNSQKEFKLGYIGYISLQGQNLCLIHLFHLSLTDAVIKTVTLQASGDCLLESPAIKTVIIKQLFPCSRYSVTFTKTYLQSFWQTFLMLNKIQGPVSIINWV